MVEDLTLREKKNPTNIMSASATKGYNDCVCSAFSLKRDGTSQPHGRCSKSALINSKVYVKV